MQPGAETQQREVVARGVEAVDGRHVVGHVALGRGDRVVGGGQIDGTDSSGVGGGAVHDALTHRLAPDNELEVEAVAKRQGPGQSGGEQFLVEVTVDLEAFTDVVFRTARIDELPVPDALLCRGQFEKLIGNHAGRNRTDFVHAGPHLWGEISGTVKKGRIEPAAPVHRSSTPEPAQAEKEHRHTLFSGARPGSRGEGLTRPRDITSSSPTEGVVTQPIDVL